jgi:hypothetical protein
VVVRGVENLGLTQAFGAILLGLAGPSPFGAVASTAIGTALLSVTHQARPAYAHRAWPSAVRHAQEDCRRFGESL